LNEQKDRKDDEEFGQDFLNELLYGEEENEYGEKLKSKPSYQKSERERKNVYIALPLETAIRRYCDFNEEKYGIPFKDLTNERNFKGRKGTHEVDFLISDMIGIEAKNWDCYLHKGYDIVKRDMKNQVIDKFKKYPEVKKILIIGKPNWKDGKEYLLKNNVYIIELGFQVTWESFHKAYDIIKAELDNILFLPYPLLKHII
jgi:hypothetical protein